MITNLARLRGLVFSPVLDVVLLTRLERKKQEIIETLGEKTSRGIDGTWHQMFSGILEQDLFQEMVKEVLRSAEKFSEPLPLSPLPLYPSAKVLYVKTLN